MRGLCARGCGGLFLQTIEILFGVYCMGRKYGRAVGDLSKRRADFADKSQNMQTKAVTDCGR